MTMKFNINSEMKTKNCYERFQSPAVDVATEHLLRPDRLASRSLEDSSNLAIPSLKAA